MEFVYCIHAEGTDLVKIGVSSRPRRRLQNLQIGCPFPLSVIGLVAGGKDAESRIHDDLRNKRKTGEWFEDASGEIRNRFSDGGLTLDEACPSCKRGVAMNDFASYLAKNGISQRAMADRLGVHYSIVSKLCNGKGKPGLDLAVKIEDETGKEVAPRSWVRNPDNMDKAPAPKAS